MAEPTPRHTRVRTHRWLPLWATLAVSTLWACHPGSAARSATAEGSSSHAPSDASAQARSEKRVEIVSRAVAMKNDFVPELVSVAVTRENNGEGVISGLRDLAQLHGAAFMSDLSLYFVSPFEGRERECRIDFVSTDASSAAEAGGGTASRESTPVRVVRASTTRRRVCLPPGGFGDNLEEREHRQFCEAVTEPMPSNPTPVAPRDPKGTPISPQLQRTRTVMRCRNESPIPSCHFESVTRNVTRYEIDTSLDFEPASASFLASYKLQESGPVCRVLNQGEVSQGSRLQGTIYLPRR